MGVWDFVTETAGNVWDAGASAVDTVVETGSELGHTVYDTASELGRTAWDTASQAGHTVVDAGRALVDQADTTVFGEHVQLTEDQIATLRRVHGEGLDLSRIDVRRGGLYALGSSRAVGNTIALTDDEFGAGGTLSPTGLETLVHESVHASQYQHEGMGYAVNSLYRQAEAGAQGSRNDAYSYDTATPWDELSPEQQASAIEDRFRSDQILNNPAHRQYYEDQIATYAGSKYSESLQRRIDLAPTVAGDVNMPAYEQQLQRGEGMATLTQGENDYGGYSYHTPASP